MLHKEEVAELFKVLANPNRVKMVKQLYNNASKTEADFKESFDCKESALRYHLDLLVKSDLIHREGNDENPVYTINKPLVEELMSFVMTPCHCCHNENK